MTAQTPDGFLCVDKPAGVSSHDMVLAVRRALGEKRVGHAGTLDPFATGLLVILVGRATRLLPYVPGDPKVYLATFAFGTETDTEDHLGTVARTAPVPCIDALAAALRAFTGELMQVPSSYSAKRVDGRRAYDVARKGGVVELEAASVRVDSIELISHTGTADAVDSCDVRITCSAGTYVRALARDIARHAESAAHVSALRRVRSGSFDVAGAYSLADLRERTATLAPALGAVPQYPTQQLSHDEVVAVARGIDVPALVPGDRVALVNAANGVLVALAERNGERWQPRVVMRPAAEAEATL